MIDPGLQNFANALSRRLRTIATDIEATRALHLNVAYGDERAKCRESVAIRAAADVIDELLTMGQLAPLFQFEVVSGQNLNLADGT